MAIGTTNVREFSDLGIIAAVSAHKDNRLAEDLDNLSIDAVTGKITLPAFLSGSTPDKMPSHFTLQVAHHKSDDRVVICQRIQGDKYRETATVAPFGELLVYTEGPCAVRTRKVPEDQQRAQNLPPVAIWVDTQMQNLRGSNRADIIRISKGGVLTLARVLIVYFDGAPRLIRENGWEGMIFRRKDPTKAYDLRSEDERITFTFYGNDAVKSIMNKFVFVPDPGYPSIEGWLQMFLLPKVRTLVESCEGLPVWHKDEHFWSKPEPKVQMTDGQGVVEWHVYGTGGTSMGYVRLHKPITHKGRTVDKVQIKHHSITSAEDDQGLKLLKPGDIVRIDRVADMDVNKTTYAPLGFVTVLYDFRDEGVEGPKVAAA